MFDRTPSWPAIIDSLRKLDPRVQWRNPVMFVVYIGSILTTALWLQALAGHLRASAACSKHTAPVMPQRPGCCLGATSICARRFRRYNQFTT